MAISGISISEERKKTMDFSEYYVTSDLIMLVKEDNTSVKTAEDIKKSDIKVGFQTGTTGQMYMEDLSLNGKSYLKYSQATKDLSNGKIDCIIVDEVIAKEIIKKSNWF